MIDSSGAAFWPPLFVAGAFISMVSLPLMYALTGLVSTWYVKEGLGTTYL